jgi:hypothetical protein
MSNQVYDVDGFVDDFATNKGTTDYFNYLRGLNDPYLEKFVEEGWDLVPEALLETLEELDPPRGEIKEVHEKFKESLMKCSGIVIISDGLNDDLDQEGEVL